MKHYRIGEFAKLVHRSPVTIRRWEKEGKITSKRMASGHRYYDDDDLRAVLAMKVEQTHTVVYCRVNTKAQKVDLDNQLETMQCWVRSSNTDVDEWITEVGSGLDYKRPKFLRLIDRICRGEIQRLVIPNKDRLTRFGYELVKRLCAQNGCELLDAKQIELSPEEDLIADLMAVLRTFSKKNSALEKYDEALRQEFPNISVIRREVD